MEFDSIGNGFWCRFLLATSYLLTNIENKVIQENRRKQSEFQGFKIHVWVLINPFFKKRNLHAQTASCATCGQSSSEIKGKSEMTLWSAGFNSFYLLENLKDCINKIIHSKFTGRRTCSNLKLDINQKQKNICTRRAKGLWTGNQ